QNGLVRRSREQGGFPEESAAGVEGTTQNGAVVVLQLDRHGFGAAQHLQGDLLPAGAAAGRGGGEDAHGPGIRVACQDIPVEGIQEARGAAAGSGEELIGGEDGSPYLILGGAVDEGADEEIEPAQVGGPPQQRLVQPGYFVSAVLRAGQD